MNTMCCVSKFVVVLVTLASLTMGVNAASLFVQLGVENDQDCHIGDISVVSSSESEVTNLGTVSFDIEAYGKINTDTVFDTYVSVDTTHFSQQAHYSYMEQRTTETSGIPDSASMDYTNDTVAETIAEQNAELADLDEAENELESTRSFLPSIWDKTTNQSSSSGLTPTLFLGIGALGVFAFLRRPR